MSHETRGNVKKFEGRTKEAAGIVTGNRELEAKGSRLRAEGEVQANVGKARRKVGDAIESVADAVKD